MQDLRNGGGGGAAPSIGPWALETLATPLHVFNKAIRQNLEGRSKKAVTYVTLDNISTNLYVDGSSMGATIAREYLLDTQF